MPDYRTMFDREYIGAWDLLGKDRTVEIESVSCKSLTSQRGTNKKPVIRFKGAEKALVCNKTNGKTIANMYGPNTDDWVGKKITIYPGTTSAGGETVECIRVRPKMPE